MEPKKPFSPTWLFQSLLAAYGRPRWWSEDPYRVIFQAVLVQHTTWANVEKTCAALGEQIAPEKVARLSPLELEELIRPCGFYKSKAPTILALTQWYRGYGFDRVAVQAVPQSRLRGELLALPGVGPETADVILTYAFYKPSFIVDAYTRRLLQRLGYAFPNDHAIRRFFEQSLPRDAEIYGHLHWLILDHCIQHCKAAPRCQGCCFAKHCKTFAEESPGDRRPLTGR